MPESDHSHEVDSIEDLESTVFRALLCTNCEAIYGHPPPVCRKCGCEQFKSRNISEKGQIYASTVIRVPGLDHKGQEPFVVGVVDVGKNPSVRVTARIESNGQLPPDSPVEYIGYYEDVFWFRPT